MPQDLCGYPSGVVGLCASAHAQCAPSFPWPIRITVGIGSPLPRDLCRYPSGVVGLCASAHAQCAPSFPWPIRITVGIARPSNPPLAPSELRLRQIEFPVLAIARTGRDSNPRLAFTNTRFPGVPDRPLRHLSLIGKNTANFALLKLQIPVRTALRDVLGRVRPRVRTRPPIHRYLNFNLNFN